MASLRQRNGWYSGRHVYIENGVRKYKTKAFQTKTLAIAKRKLWQWETELSRSEEKAAEITLSQAAQAFLNEHCVDLRPGTVERYTTSIKALRKRMGSVKLAEISKRDLLDFEKDRRKDPGSKTGTKISTSAIRRDLDCLSSIITYAIMKEWLPISYANPVSNFKKLRGKVLREGEARRRYASVEEEARIISAASVMQDAKGGSPHTRKMLYAAIICALDTGARKSEVYGLRWDDVRLGRNASIYLRDTKNGKDRKVPLLDRAAQALSELPIHERSRFVFWHRDGQRFVDQDKGFNAICAKARVEDFHWHDMRRTRGCRMLQDEGATMKEVQTWLGHDTLAITERHYAFLAEDVLDKFVWQDRDRRQTQPSAEIVPLRRGA